MPQADVKYAGAGAYDVLVKTTESTLIGLYTLTLALRSNASSASSRSHALSDAVAIVAASSPLSSAFIALRIVFFAAPRSADIETWRSGVRLADSTMPRRIGSCVSMHGPRAR